MRGFSLLSTFLVTGLVSTMALTLAVVCLYQLQASQGMVARQAALNLAESAVALTCSRLVRDPDYARRTTVEGPGGLGLVTFAPGDAEGGVVLSASLNNLKGTSPRNGGSGRSVPPGCAQVVGVGIVPGAVARVELVLSKPQFGYAIATSGSFLSQGNLLVGSVKDGSEVAAALQDPTKLRPGHLASNSSAANAVILNPGADVKGDVRAVGGVKLEGGALVGGKVTPGSSHVELPKVDLGDPTAQYATQTVTLPATLTEGLTGFNRRAGNLKVRGDLELNGAVVYVDGDLEVSGAIKGRGAIFVNGKTLVQGGGSALGAESQMAIVSKGDVTLQGHSGKPSQFAGVIYTEGRLKAEDITLVGAFVGNGEKSDVELKDVVLIENPDARRLDLKVLPPTGKARSNSEQAVKPWVDPDRPQVWTGESATVTARPPKMGFFYDAENDRFTTAGHTLGDFLKISISSGSISTGFETHFYGTHSEFKEKMATDRYFRRNFGRDIGPVTASAKRLEKALQAEIDAFNEQYQRTKVTEPQAAPTDWHFDLSRFLNQGDGVRQLLWRRL